MPPCSSAYMRTARLICFRLLMHATRWADPLARPRAGSNKAARMPMIPMTTSNSIRVKPPGVGVGQGTGALQDGCAFSGGSPFCILLGFTLCLGLSVHHSAVLWQEQAERGRLRLS